MYRRWLAVVLLMGTATEPAYARGSAHEAGLLALRAPEPASAEHGFSLQDQISGLLEMRRSAIDQLAPLPPANAASPEQISRRLAALQDLNAFAQATVSGLIEAAPTIELRRQLGDKLMPILDDHEREVAEALVAMLDLPLVRAEGWFVISRFGAQADRNAGTLVQAAAADRLSKARILARLKELAPRGETSSDVLAMVAGTVNKKP